jgi:hypothetical protein
MMFRLGLPFRAGCVLAFWLGVACKSPVGDTDSTVPGKCSSTAPLLAAQKTDILFIVDNSESMSDKQAEVAQELPAFVNELQQGAGLQQDFQMGLVTTSVYQNALYNGVLYYQRYPTQSGILQPVPDASPDGGVVLGTGTERILSGGDPDLVDKFGRLVRVGISGSGQETPFEAIRLATTYWADIPVDAGGNGGFLRDGSQLLLITVMDEDDCSEFDNIADAGWRPQVYVGVDKNRAPNYIDYCTEQSAKLGTLQAYYDAYTTLTDSTGALRPIIWADIAPVSLLDKSAQAYPDYDAGTLRNVDCPNSFGAGYRHRAMAALFDQSLGDLNSICNLNFSQSLIDIAGRAVAVQTIQVYNVPDPSLLRLDLTRADGSVSLCTVANGGITFEVTPSGEELVHFGSTCARRIDDTAVNIELICAG